MTDYPDPLSLAGSLLSPIELTSDWQNEDERGWIARFKRLWFRPGPGEYHAEDWNVEQYDVYYPLSVGSKPPGEQGTRAYAVYRGRWEIIVFGDTQPDAKELFPAVVYKRTREEILDDGSAKQVVETFVICPGGRGTEKSIKTVHVLHVEGRKMSTSTFGALPVAMNNFGAALADNGYGEPMLVCAPGEVDEGSRYPVQRYEFSQELWTKSDTTQSLAGCPAYEKDGDIVVAGGQAAYHVSNPVKTSTSGATQFYGHHTTPFWSIDPIAGTLETRTPRRLIVSGTAETAESAVVNQQKRFLKQNFSGIPIRREPGPVEFIAVGGTELLGYQADAVVSYAMNSTGPVLDCENAPVRIGGDCETFPDTPKPLGECRAVRIRRRRSGGRIVDCDILLCVGGRYREENGKFVYHEKPWSLDLENKDEGWRNDLFPKLTTPRINAALSDVVTIAEKELDENGEETGRTVDVDRVFLIGGRTDKGLTASIEALNLTTGEWETDWPGLHGITPKKTENENDE